MDRACARAARTGQRFYLYGGRNPGALAQLTRTLRLRHPGLKIVGGYAPPFRPLTDAEEDAVVADIDALRRGRRLGRHRRAQAGEVDGADARPPGRAGPGRRRRRVRLPRRTRPAGPARDAALRPRMAVPPDAGAAPPVASLRALQPALRHRLRAPVRAAPPPRAADADAHARTDRRRAGRRRSPCARAARAVARPSRGGATASARPGGRGDFSRSGPRCTTGRQAASATSNATGASSSRPARTTATTSPTPYFLERGARLARACRRAGPRPASRGRARAPRRARVQLRARRRATTPRPTVTLRYARAMTTVASCRGCRGAAASTWPRDAVVQEAPDHEFTVPARTLSLGPRQASAPVIDLALARRRGPRPQVLARPRLERTRRAVIRRRVRTIGHGAASARSGASATATSRAVEALTPTHMPTDDASLTGRKCATTSPSSDSAGSACRSPSASPTAACRCSAWTTTRSACRPSASGGCRSRSRARTS